MDPNRRSAGTSKLVSPNFLKCDLSASFQNDRTGFNLTPSDTIDGPHIAYAINIHIKIHKDIYIHTHVSSIQ